jgi:hypothetical protein
MNVAQCCTIVEANDCEAKFRCRYPRVRPVFSHTEPENVRLADKIAKEIKTPALCLLSGRRVLTETEKRGMAILGT